MFNVGYNYSFETIGSDVKINFELLDKDKVGVVAYLRKQSPFSETQMANVSEKIFTQTISGQSNGATINYACKFAYAGGSSVTNYFSYVVGDNCALGVTTSLEVAQFSFQNPATEYVRISSKNRY